MSRIKGIIDAVSDLAMDYQSRMARAKEQGFDTDTPYYHGSDDNIDAFDINKVGQNTITNTFPNGFWFSPEKKIAKGYGSNIHEVYLNKGVSNPGSLAGKDLFDAGVGDSVEYPRAIVLRDPSRIRSVNAAFNPAKKDSSNLLAGVTGAGLLGGLMVASEDAEAGPISEALNLGQRVLQLGILKAESAGNPNAVKTAITKYQNAMRNNPAFADRERRAYANDYETVFSAASIPDRQIITPESLVGKTLTPVRGDRSDIGHLSQVGGIPIDVPVEGGNKFSRQYGGWASAEPIARGQHNKHIAAAEDTQNDVFGVYNTMGRDSVNFSTPIAEGMMQQIPELRRLAKADINDFDKEIRSLKSVKYVKGGDNVTTYPYSDWVGLDHPDAMSQLMGENGYPRWGKLRTAFTTTMGKAAYRDKGFPSYDELVKATEDPALVSASIGDSGHSIYKADTTKGAQPFDQHKTYDYQMPGEYAGGFEQSVPFNVMFPKSFDRFINTKTKSGKLMTPDQATVATNIRKDGYEVADQQWLDGVQGFIDRNKQRVAAGGLLASGGANANTVSQPQSGGLLDSIGDTALETMSGVNRAMADGVNFLTSDQINAILNLSGSDKRIPDLYDIPGVESGTKGNYMEPGLLRQIVRQGSEFLSPI